MPKTPRLTAPVLVAARARARAGLIASIGVAMALSIALLTGLSAVVSIETTVALRSALAGDGAYAQVQTRIADDPAAQDAAAEEFFAARFGDAATIEEIAVGEPGTDGERVAWRVIPDAELLDAQRLERLRVGVEGLPTAFLDSDVAVRGAEFSGPLGELLAAATTGAAAAAAIAPVPLALIGVLAWFAAMELARLLGASRGREAVLLRARGLSRGQGAALAAVESAVISVGAGVIGCGAAAGVLALRYGMPGTLALVDTWPLAAIAVVVLAVTLGVQAARAADAAGSARAGAGRVGRAATVGVALLVVLGAAVFVWQALATRGGAPDDPWRVAMLTLAPTFGVAAVAIVAVLLFAPAASAFARVAASRPDVSPAYPARQVSRRIVAFSTAVALVAIAAAGGVLAATYLGSWRLASEATARVAAGTELRASTPATTQALAVAQGVEGVTAAAPALLAPVVAGSLSASLVALPAEATAHVAVPVPGLVDPAALSDALAPELVAPVLPDGAGGLGFAAQVTSAAPAAIDTLTVRATVMDAEGAVVRVRFGDLDTTPGAGATTVAATAELPEGVAPWRLLSVDITRSRAHIEQRVLVADAEISVFVGALPTTPDAADPLDLEVTPTVELVPLVWAQNAPPPVSAAPVWTAAGSPTAATPAVVSRALAEELGLAVGDRFDARIEGTGRTYSLRVTGVIPVVPGVDRAHGILASWEALAENSLDARTDVDDAPTVPEANEVWAAGRADAAPALAAALRAATPSGAVVAVATPNDTAAALTQGLVPAWWAAALGGAVLAGVALVALLAALAGGRAGEVLVLRALGVTPRRQARMRAVEASAVVILAAALGLIGGGMLGALVVPVMTEAAVPGSELVPALAVDPWALVAVVAVLAAALAGAILFAARGIRRLGASTRLEEAAP